MSWGATAAFLAGNPYFWAVVIGFFAALALSLATTSSARAADPERARQRNVTIAIFALTWVVVAFVSGVLLVQAINPRSLPVFRSVRYWWYVAALVPALAVPLRFPRTLGVIMVLSCAGVTFGFARIALYRVPLSVFPVVLGTAEVVDDDGQTLVLRLNSDGAPTAEYAINRSTPAEWPRWDVVVVRPELSTFGANGWYRPPAGLASPVHEQTGNLDPEPAGYRDPAPVELAPAPADGDPAPAPAPAQAGVWTESVVGWLVDPLRLAVRFNATLNIDRLQLGARYDLLLDQTGLISNRLVPE